MSIVNQISSHAPSDQQVQSINWTTASFMIIFHIGAVAALFMFSWKALVISLLLWWVSGSLGIGIGFHRLLTHRGYKTPKAVEYFLTLCGTLALEGGAINWVVTHRIHHAHTDASGDPHTPRDGRWWAHMGWILRGTAQQHEASVMQRYAPDLTKDPVHVWLNRLYFVPLILLGVASFCCHVRFGRFTLFLICLFIPRFLFCPQVQLNLELSIFLPF